MNPVLNFLERLRLNTKLMLGLGLMMAIIIMIGLQAIYSVRLQSAEISRMYELELQGISHIKEATIEFMQMGRSLRQMILSPDAKSRDSARADLGEARTKMNRELKSSDALFVRPEGRALLADIQDVMTQYLRNVDHVVALIDNDKTLQNSEITRFLATPANVLVFEKTDKLMTDLVRHKEEAARLAAQGAIEFSQRIEHWTVALLLVGVAAGLGAGLMLSVSLRRPSERLRLSVERLAQGDLETKVPHTEFENELGAMARSVNVLQKGAAQADILRWSKTQANLIGVNVQAIERLNEFADTLLAQLTPLLQAQLGLLYVFDKASEKYRYQGGYGLAIDPSDMP
ncbi:MAG: MCP four helix bundle domain-containing protein, partial [Comamonadaceae bacterium]